ncbi:transposase family protein [Pseudoroseomonas wenyumeiae]
MRRRRPTCETCHAQASAAPDPGGVAGPADPAGAGRPRHCGRVAEQGSGLPGLRHSSAVVHSRYDHRLQDLPWQGRPATLRIQARRLRCRNRECRRQTLSSAWQRAPQVGHVAPFRRPICSGISASPWAVRPARGSRRGWPFPSVLTRCSAWPVGVVRRQSPGRLHVFSGSMTGLGAAATGTAASSSTYSATGCLISCQIARPRP